jgi:hypothetical protein
MGQILHGSATTTEAVRRAIQHSQESLRGLAKRYRVNPKTVAKWKARSSVSDLPTAHLQNFVDAYNFARRLKTLRGLTPYEFISKAWTSEPHRFKISPLQQMPGLNS